MTRLRHSLRRLLQTPGFALLAILTLAMGLGANIAIFAIVDGILLRPLSFPAAERLVYVGHRAPGLSTRALHQSEALYLHYLETAGSFEGMALIDQTAVTLTGEGAPRRLEAVEATPEALDVLRVRPVVGRFFEAADGRPGAQPRVVLSERLWRLELGGDPRAIGRLLEIDGRGHEVLGVAPDVRLDDVHPELWLPRVVDPEDAPLGAFGAFGFGRLAPGVTPAQAQADLERSTLPLTETFPDEGAAQVLEDSGFRIAVHGLRHEIVRDVRPALWILVGTVGFVLLIACANVANLFLARMERRRREIAVRTALGASRLELSLDGLAESLLLALLGGAAGLGLAAGSLHALRTVGPQSLPRLHEIGVDWRVGAFAVALSLAAGVLFAIIPLVRSGVRDLVATLKDGGRSASPGRSQHRTRHTLVVVQVAMAVALLVGAGLMVRSYERLIDLDPGFEADGATLSLGLSLPEASYDDDEKAVQFFGTLVDELSALPGVAAVGVTSTVPLSGESNGGGHAIESQPLRSGEPPPLFRIEIIGGDYLEALGLSVVEGRGLTREETLRRAPLCLINRALADRRFGDASPVGARITREVSIGEETVWWTIVGVVETVHAERLTDEPSETVYYPLLPLEEDAWVPRDMDVVVRLAREELVLGTAGDALVDAIRSTVWELDAALPVSDPVTLRQLLERARARMAFTVALLVLAAAVALLLGTIGTYGVVSYLVAERRAEIGVRLALGAQARDIVALVLRHGVVLAGVGVLLGLLAAAALSRTLESLLFEIEPYDPLTFVLVPWLLLAVVALASLRPALRATRTDPMIVLREQ